MREVSPEVDAPLLVVLRALGLGDMLTAVPALRGLRRSHPGHRVVMYAPAGLRSLAVAAGADDVMPAAGLGRLAPPPTAPAVAVNLHGRGPESHRLLMDLAPHRLIAFAHRDIAGTAGFPEWMRDEHEVLRWCRMLRGFGIPADPDDLRLPEPDPLPWARGAVVIHPGAASGARRWPLERWARVVTTLDAGRPIVVTGSSGERALAGRLEELVRPRRVRITAGETDIPALCRIVAAAAVVASGDTGIAHLAFALGRPSVTLYGPTSPHLWGPRPGSARHRVLWTGPSGDPHGTRPHRGLLEITAPEVVEAIAAATAGVEPVPLRGAR